MITLREIKIKNALSRSGLKGLDYALNPYVGCIHGCRYCYARDYTRYREVSENWGFVVYVKRNLLDVLQKEVRFRSRGVVGIGTITDPYQPIEIEYEITRKAIEILTTKGFSISIQTKSYLVVRDIDILNKVKDLVDVGITITSLDNYFAKKFEPRASPPSQRIEALRRLSSAGIKTWIFLGPIIPGENDSIDMIRDIVDLANETRSTLYVDRLRIKKFMTRSSSMRIYIDKTLSYPWRELYRKIENMCRSRGIKLFIEDTEVI